MERPAPEESERGQPKDGLCGALGAALKLREPDQQVGDDGGDDLQRNRVLVLADEVVEPEVLLQPLEKQLDLPAALIEVGDFGGSDLRSLVTRSAFGPC